MNSEMREAMARASARSCQAQHGQGVAQAGEAEADAALVGGFFLLALEGPVGGVQHVVQHAGGDLDDFAEGLEIKLGLFGEGVVREQGQVDGAQAAAAIGRQGLLRGWWPRSARNS